VSCSLVSVVSLVVRRVAARSPKGHYEVTLYLVMQYCMQVLKGHYVVVRGIDAG
jgi:hypothetical protein